MDVDLALVPPDQPGLVRRPDLVVVDDKSVDRVDRDGGLLRAGDVLLVVEIVSAGARRLDHVVKRGEYADVGIEHYWIIDLDKPVTLLDCRLAGTLGYVDGVLTATVPKTEAAKPRRIEITALRPLVTLAQSYRRAILHCMNIRGVLSAWTRAPFQLGKGRP